MTTNRCPEAVMTFREIAEELNVSLSTVESYFYSAVEKLRKAAKLKDLLKLVASKDYVDLNWNERRSWRARRNRRRPRKV